MWNEQKIAELHCLRWTPKDEPSQRANLFLHGYGASEKDFAPILEFLHTEPRYHWVFARAPLEMDIGFGQIGYAWFPIDAQQLMNRQSEGYRLDQIEAFQTAKKKVEAVIQTLQSEGLQLALGGFSQGSMIATDIYLDRPQEFLGLQVLSGTMIHELHWKERIRSIQGNCFQTHGRQDPVLPYAQAAEFNKVCEKAGWKSKLHFFNGGHEAGPIFKDWSQYLNEIAS